MIPCLRKVALTGHVRGGQLRLVCPLCRKKSLDIRLGASALLAACLNDAPPSCRGRGYSILTRLGLTAAPLSPAAREWAKREVFGGDNANLPPAQDVEILHAVYSAWLRLCPLSDEDREGLYARGFNDMEIGTYGYGSWEGRLDAGALPRVDGIPGVDGGKVALAERAYAGLLIPCRDVTGRIFALKVRLRRPDEAGKMRTFSSAHYGGPAGAYGVHVPLGTPRPSAKVWVVEGELKADLVHAKTGHPVVGIPGVNGV